MSSRGLGTYLCEGQPPVASSRKQDRIVSVSAVFVGMECRGASGKLRGVLVMPGLLLAADLQIVFEIDPEEPSNMNFFSALECTQATPQRVRLKDVAPSNMPVISITCETFHVERSWLKDVAP